MVWVKPVHQRPSYAHEAGAWSRSLSRLDIGGEEASAAGDWVASPSWGERVAGPARAAPRPPGVESATTPRCYTGGGVSPSLEYLALHRKAWSEPVTSNPKYIAPRELPAGRGAPIPIRHTSSQPLPGGGGGLASGPLHPPTPSRSHAPRFTRGPLFDPVFVPCAHKASALEPAWAAARILGPREPGRIWEQASGGARARPVERLQGTATPA